MVLVVYFDMRLYYSSDYDNCGQRMWKHCPKKINGVVGYRTKMSMINMDTWRFVHDHAGKLWWKVGIGLLGPTMLIHIPFYGASDDTMGILSIIIIVIQLVFLIGSIFPTEKALKIISGGGDKAIDSNLID